MINIKSLGNNPKYDASNTNKKGDLRKHTNTFIAKLRNIPNGTKFRHVGEDLYAIKLCDAYQEVYCGEFTKQAIFSINDLVEVI